MIQLVGSGGVGWLLGDGVSGRSVNRNGANGRSSGLRDIDRHLSVLVDGGVDVGQVDVLRKGELASERSKKGKFK